MDIEEVILSMGAKQGGVQTGAGNTSHRSLAPGAVQAEKNIVGALASPNSQPIATIPQANNEKQPPRSVEGRVIGDAAGAAVGAAVEFLTDGLATPEAAELIELTSSAVERMADSETIGEVIDEAEGIVTGRKPSGKVPTVPDFLKQVEGELSGNEERLSSFRKNYQYAPHAPSTPPTTPPRSEEDEDVRILRSVKKHDASVVLHPPLSHHTHGKGKGKKGAP